MRIAIVPGPARTASQHDRAALRIHLVHHIDGCLIGVPLVAAYSAAKPGGVVCSGVRVNGIAPAGLYIGHLYSLRGSISSTGFF